MNFLDLTLPTLAENLALDEALLEEAETAGQPREVLRLWESPEFAVVLGRASKRAVEANIEHCEADGVPIVRRCSGGCAVVIGPGCLMYSVVLSYEQRSHLRALDEAHRFVMGTIQTAVSSLLDGVEFQGTCDLTWQGRKFSGNSLRCKHDHLLYHGTLLYDFPLPRVERYLLKPPREPDYRAGRSHREFVGNIHVQADALRAALANAFGVGRSRASSHDEMTYPRERMQRLIAERYSRREWHEER